MKLFTLISISDNHLFLDNKYTRWYYNIIQNAHQRKICDDYTELHHIIPNCFYINNRSKGRNIG